MQPAIYNLGSIETAGIYRFVTINNPEWPNEVNAYLNDMWKGIHLYVSPATRQMLTRSDKNMPPEPFTFNLPAYNDHMFFEKCEGTITLNLVE